MRSKSYLITRWLNVSIKLIIILIALPNVSCYTKFDFQHCCISEKSRFENLHICLVENK